MQVPFDRVAPEEVELSCRIVLEDPEHFCLQVDGPTPEDFGPRLRLYATEQGRLRSLPSPTPVKGCLKFVVAELLEVAPAAVESAFIERAQIPGDSSTPGILVVLHSRPLEVVDMPRSLDTATPRICLTREDMRMTLTGAHWAIEKPPVSLDNPIQASSGDTLPSIAVEIEGIHDYSGLRDGDALPSHAIGPEGVTGSPYALDAGRHTVGTTQTRRH